MVKKVSIFTKAVQVLDANVFITIRNNFYTRINNMERSNAIETAFPLASATCFSYKSNYFVSAS
jgi:hypothetical protein